MTLFVYTASAVDDKGVVKCFVHDIPARKEAGRWCTHGAASRCLHCVYYVCAAETKRCEFFWWAGAEEDTKPPASSQSSSESDMSNVPSQQRRAARARGQSGSVSPQKRARSISPPPSEQNPPVTPQAKRMAAIRLGLTPSTNAAPPTPSSKHTPSSTMTPEQRAIRDKFIADGLAHHAPTTGGQTKDKGKTPREKAISAGLNERMEAQDDRTLFSPSTSKTRLRGIDEALLAARPGMSSDFPRPSDGRTFDNMDTGIGGRDREHVPMDETDEESWWTSPPRGAGRNHQQTANASAGPSNHRSAPSVLDQEPDGSQDSEGRPRTPPGLAHGGKAKGRGIPTPPQSGSHTRGEDVEDIEEDEELERGRTSPSSTAQVAEYLEVDEIEEIEPSAPPTARADKGKQREGTAPNKAQSTRLEPDEDNPFEDRERAAAPQRDSAPKDTPDSGAEALKQHATALLDLADYVRELEKEQTISQAIINQQREKIGQLQADKQKLKAEIKALKRTARERDVMR